MVDALFPNLPWGLNLLTSWTLILNVLEGNRCKKSCPSCFCRKTRTDGRTLPRLTQSWIFSSSLWTQEESRYHNHFYPNPGNKKRRNNHKSQIREFKQPRFDWRTSTGRNQIREFKQPRFDWRMSTGSEPFSLFNCLHATKSVFLRPGSDAELFMSRT